MKLSCLPVSLYSDIISGKMTMEEWADEASAMGLDAIDVSILFFHNHTSNYLTGIHSILRERNVDITMIVVYPNFTHPDALQRKRELDYCIRDIALASQLDIRYVRITAGQRYPETNMEELAKQVTHYFLRCEEKAKEYGVSLVYENHGRPAAWQDFDFTYDTKAFLALTHHLRGSEVRVNFDTANTVAFGDDPLPVFEEIFPQIETIHVADTVAYGTFKHVDIGSGKAPIQEILARARKKGYDGWLCIEEGSGHGLEGVRRAVQTVRRMWENKY